MVQYQTSPARILGIGTIQSVQLTRRASLMSEVERRQTLLLPVNNVTELCLSQQQRSYDDNNNTNNNGEVYRAVAKISTVE